MKYDTDVKLWIRFPEILRNIKKNMNSFTKQTICTVIIKKGRIKLQRTKIERNKNLKSRSFNHLLLTIITQYNH